MPGRPLLRNDLTLANFGQNCPEVDRRRIVLKETIDQFASAQSPDHYLRLAQTNLKQWSESASPNVHPSKVQVLEGDWGEVTLNLTRAYGACFAVLNMANGYVPGGAYVEGAPAQEENMFRRTDCHFRVGPDEYDEARDRYHSWMTSLLNAEEGRVYLDNNRPRVCIRGREDRSRSDLGYRWLEDDEVFPFYELRASAVDLRSGESFSEGEMRRRIAAQLETLIEHDARHAVLGAFGCGAFQNPASEVARLYREEIEQRRGEFSVIAFAIYDAGYGPNNFAPFDEEFQPGVYLGS